MKVGGCGDGLTGLRREVQQLLARFNDEQWQQRVADQWADQLVRSSYVPMARSDVQDRLRRLTGVIVTALQDPAGIEDAGQLVGTSLVGMHATAEGSLSESIDVLREHLIADADSELNQRVLQLLVAVAAGFAAADRESTLEQQEILRRALLRSKLQTERDLKASEARFREMFSSTPIGVAICQLDGRFVEVNNALEETLGYSAEALQGKTIYELFHPAELAAITSSLEGLVQGTRERLRERRSLVREDGSNAWTYVAVSLLRDADGKPVHFVVVVEDLRELSHLQDQLRHQSLHDAMTGLANRQHLSTRLETALGTHPKDTIFTLYHLGLDGLALINDGLGYESGDKMVHEVAKRLQRLVENETALVARIGGTEFAILLKQHPDTPDIAAFAAIINDELAEPIYVHEHGIAMSASIGVTQRVAAGAKADDMLWEADVALRHARVAGTRQWALFDEDRAPRERTDAKLAAVMPGALELGEFDVVYRPLVSISDHRIVAVEAQLAWWPDGHEQLDHSECLRLAEQSGITLPLRDWMLRTAWEQLADWHETGNTVRLVAGLSPNQSRDPDLVARVRAIVGRSDVEAHWMRVCMPIRALMGEAGDARDNVAILSSIGIQTAVHDFQGAPDELLCLRQVPACAVQFSNELVEMINGRDDDDSLEVRAVAAMVPLIHDTGVPVAVAGVDNEEQAQWWLSMGCEIGAGLAYSVPVSAAKMTELLEADAVRN